MKRTVRVPSRPSVAEDSSNLMATDCCYRIFSWKRHPRHRSYWRGLHCSMEASCEQADAAAGHSTMRRVAGALEAVLSSGRQGSVQHRQTWVRARSSARPLWNRTSAQHQDSAGALTPQRALGMCIAPGRSPSPFLADALERRWLGSCIRPPARRTAPRPRSMCSMEAICPLGQPHPSDGRFPTPASRSVLIIQRLSLDPVFRLFPWPIAQSPMVPAH
jgi:hypothetical protein